MNNDNKSTITKILGIGAAILGLGAVLVSTRKKNNDAIEAEFIDGEIETDATENIECGCEETTNEPE